MTHGTPARAKTRNVARRDSDPARRVAYEALRAVAVDDAYANLVLPRLLRDARLHGRDAAFATELTYGTLRGRGTYDAVIGACVDRPLADVDPPLLDALRLGAHQLLAMRVPPHAAVDATVDVVRAQVGQGAAGFANAVLRKVSRQGLDGWLAELAPERDDGSGAGPDARLAVVHSHPEWVVRALRDALRFAGRDAGELEALLAADNARPQVTLVALPGLAEPDQLPAAAGGGTAGPAGSPLAVRISGAPTDVPALGEGRARVQDEGSQLVTLALAAATLLGGADGHGADGGRWLDLCAGPGGKAALLGAVLGVRRDAGRVPGSAVLVANDVSAHRADLVDISVAGVLHRWPGLVDVRSADGRAVGGYEPGGYDRVLVDAPCTGLGALRRRPEARWRRTPAALAGLGPLQRELLTSALAAVRPGGVVAYVTCSPHPAETRLVVDDVLRGRGDVERLDARSALAAATDGRARDLGGGPDVQLWPHVHGTDAMFLALLRRRT
jgi:16S rRNA (cytosine967-C5)-methyltransferase